VIAYPLFVISADRIVPNRRWRYLIGVPVALGLAAIVFFIGLVPILTYTTCAD
jgi:hypothetical protein